MRELPQPVILLMIGIIGITGSFSALIQRSEIDKLEEQLKQPSYYCDGSETRGFATPGTPEAAACWFEVKK